MYARLWLLAIIQLSFLALLLACTGTVQRTGQGNANYPTYRASANPTPHEEATAAPPLAACPRITFVKRITSFADLFLEK